MCWFTLHSLEIWSLASFQACLQLFGCFDTTGLSWTIRLLRFKHQILFAHRPRVSFLSKFFEGLINVHTRQWNVFVRSFLKVIPTMLEKSFSIMGVAMILAESSKSVASGCHADQKRIAASAPLLTGDTRYLKLSKINHWALTLSWRRPLSYRNQSIDLLCKSMDWFLYDKILRHERVKFIEKLTLCLSWRKLKHFMKKGIFDICIRDRYYQSNSSSFLTLSTFYPILWNYRILNCSLYISKSLFE